MAGGGVLLGHPHPPMGHDVGPVAPPVKAKYQRTAKGRKGKANLMLAAVVEDAVAPPGPLMIPQRNNFGHPMGASNYGQMGGGGGGFMENGGGFQHQFYGHIHEGSPHSFYGGGEGVGVGQQQQHLMGGNSLRVLPSFDQDFLRGPHHQQQQQRPFYTTAGGGMVAAGGGMKQHPMEPHEQDYDALHRHHLSPPSTAPGGGVKRDCHGDANNNCDFSEMRMFNGIKSEFPGEDHSSSGGGGRLSSPMTNTNATTPDDVLEEL